MFLDVSERTKKTVVVFGFVFSGGEGAGRLSADGTHNYFLVVSKKTVVLWVDFGVASRIQSETDQDARSVTLGQRSKDRNRATTVVEKGTVHVYGQFLCVWSDIGSGIGLKTRVISEPAFNVGHSLSPPSHFAQKFNVARSIPPLSW